MAVRGRHSVRRSGPTIGYQAGAPYQIHQPVDMWNTLPNLTRSVLVCARGANPLVILVWWWVALPFPTRICARGADPIGGFGLVGPPFTNPYQVSDLGWPLPCGTFTNLYHREGGTGD